MDTVDTATAVSKPAGQRWMRLLLKTPADFSRPLPSKQQSDEVPSSISSSQPQYLQSHACLPLPHLLARDGSADDYRLGRYSATPGQYAAYPFHRPHQFPASGPPMLQTPQEWTRPPYLHLLPEPPPVFPPASAPQMPFVDVLPPSRKYSQDEKEEGLELELDEAVVKKLLRSGPAQRYMKGKCYQNATTEPLHCLRELVTLILIWDESDSKAVMTTIINNILAWFADRLILA